VPDEIDLLIAQSREREDAGDYEAARIAAEQAVALGGGGRAKARLAGIARSERRPQAALDLLADEENGPEVLAERAAALEQLARFDEADALAAAVASDDPYVVQSILLTRAGIARGRGDYAAAERELRGAIAHAELAFGPGALETAVPLNSLGMTFKYSGRFGEGLELYRRALAIVEGRFGELHPDVAGLHHNIGGLEHARRNFEAAEPHARKSVEIRRALAGEDDPAVAEDEAAWAPILHALGRDDEAEALLRHALAVLAAAFGDEHPEVAGAWNNLAAVLQSRGDLDGANEAYLRALAAKERAFGPNHPATAITLNNLAVNARRRGAPGEAEELYRRALAALETVEPDHPNRLLTLRNYAKLLRSLGREEDAVAIEGKIPAATPVQ
jgi:tetratricopeptide (TPR) repeat protein